jgi:hypothetical protein
MQQQSFAPVFPNVKYFIYWMNHFVKTIFKNGVPHEIFESIFEQVKKNLLGRFLLEINARTISAAGVSTNLEFEITRTRNRAVTFDCIRAILEMSISDNRIVYLPDTFRTTDTEFLSAFSNNDKYGDKIYFINDMFRTMNMIGIKKQHGKDYFITARVIFINLQE